MKILVGRARPLHLFLVSVAALVIVLLLPSRSWADSCSGSLPTFCTLPETTPEATLALSLTGLSFNASAQGVVVIYDDVAHTLISDVAIFANVAGVATVTFVSDLEGPLAVPPGLPILGKFTEGSPISISIALTNGQFVTAKICSDVTEATGCDSSSDSIGLKETTSAVPEPGTLLLVGSGVLGSGFWGRSRSRLWRLARGSQG
ncbi:MAG: hypothetical protein DMG71_02725 [Acidobacteria bacterium]|nr:MAG: hypothetical protein DMG71_02725 [Acidobacteriota bacterium]